MHVVNISLMLSVFVLFIDLLVVVAPHSVLDALLLLLSLVRLNLRADEVIQIEQVPSIRVLLLDDTVSPLVHVSLGLIGRGVDH